MFLLQKSLLITKKCFVFIKKGFLSLKNFKKLNKYFWNTFHNIYVNKIKILNENVEFFHFFYWRLINKKNLFEIDFIKEKKIYNSKLLKIEKSSLVSI